MSEYHLYQGDCVELIQTIPSNSIDLTITSPPYDKIRNYHDNLVYWDFNKFQTLAQELYRVTTDGGVVVWVTADQTIKGSESGTSFKQALWFMECGFNLHDTMIYGKENPCAIASLPGLFDGLDNINNTLRQIAYN